VVHMVAMSTTLDTPPERISETTIKTRLPRSLHAELAALARAGDRPLSREIRRAIAEYVERHRDEAGK
jgi:predicted transcriptional regulator